MAVYSVQYKVDLANRKKTVEVEVLVELVAMKIK